MLCQLNKIAIVAWTSSSHSECMNSGPKPTQSLLRSLLKADIMHAAELVDVTEKFEEKANEVHELPQKLHHMTDSGIAEVGEDTSLFPSNVDGAIVVNRK